MWPRSCLFHRPPCPTSLPSRGAQVLTAPGLLALGGSHQPPCDQVPRWPSTRYPDALIHGSPLPQPGLPVGRGPSGFWWSMGLRVGTTRSPGFLVESPRRALASMSSNDRLRCIVRIHRGVARLGHAQLSAEGSSRQSQQVQHLPSPPPCSQQATCFWHLTCHLSHVPWSLPAPGEALASLSFCQHLLKFPPSPYEVGGGAHGLGGPGPQQAYLLGCWLAPRGPLWTHALTPHPASVARVVGGVTGYKAW